MRDCIRRNILLSFIVLMLVTGQSNGQLFHRSPDRKLFGASHRHIKKEAKVKESPKVIRAKKKQEANDRRLKKEYEEAVKENQQRSYDIQTPEVKERMKQNKKDIAVRDKEKRKKMRGGTKKGQAKYN